MRISTLFYIIRQGFRNIFRNRWFTLASIVTMSTCLFLLGVFYCVAENVNHIVKAAESEVSIVVFFDDGLEQDRIYAIGDMIRARAEVDHADYVSAEEAWEEFSVDYIGDSAVTFTENPLENSSNYQVYLKDVDGQADLVTYIESIDGVRMVKRSELVADMLSGVNRLISYVSLALIALLLIVAIFLISNTVTVGISVRKDEIEIMKYVGATDFFVRSPFVIEGLVIGFIGSLIPLTIIYYVYDRVAGYITSKFAILRSALSFIPIAQIFHTLAPLTVIVGVGIGFLGSYVTVRRHLHV